MIKLITRFWWICLLLGMGIDYFFWGKAPGISFPLFVLLVVMAGLLLAAGEGVQPSRSSLLLLLPVAFFAGMSAVRSEGFTRFVDFWLTLGLMALLAVSFRGGGWSIYRIRDYVINAVRLGYNSLRLPALLVYENRRERPATARRAVPYLRGALLAFPVLLIFIPLLSSADPVFSSGVEQVLKALRLEKLFEYSFRSMVILAGAYLLAGVFLHAITASDDRQRIKPETPLPFSLGLIEAAIILFCVNLLFSVFVAVQFRYFFGGQGNISLEGFTYAEYARRGFGELLVVSFFSLLLFLGLSIIARRQSGSQRRLFSLLGVWLVVLVLVILFSAFQRLLLYEQAYGFTRLRTYTHLYMWWLGVLLLAVLILELSGRLRLFALALLLVVLGFGVTLNIVNIDRFIVQQNAGRALAGEELDSEYLGTLSNDAVPALAQAFHSQPASSDLKDDLGGLLACRAALSDDQVDKTAWQSFHLGRQRANAILRSLQPELNEYPVETNSYGNLEVNVNGQVRGCYPSWED
jgi:hypothetical protein